MCVCVHVRECVHACVRLGVYGGWNFANFLILQLDFLGKFMKTVVGSSLSLPILAFVSSQDIRYACIKCISYVPYILHVFSTHCFFHCST